MAGVYDAFAIQRWRIMSVEAVFKMNDAVESLFNDQLSTLITKIENALGAAFPDAGKTVKFIGHHEQFQLVEIVRHARDLSFNIQRGFSSCRFFVTVAPAPTAMNDIMGTYAFGLDKVLGAERNMVLAIKVITNAEIQALLD